MSAVNVTNVTVLDNPSMFLNPFQFEISYECLVPLNDGECSFCSSVEMSVLYLLYGWSVLDILWVATTFDLNFAKLQVIGSCIRMYYT